MRRLALALLGALTLSVGLAAAPDMACADEAGTWRSPPPRGSERTVYRTRRVVRTVVRERPVYVYRTRRIVRIVERPVYLRPRPVYREVFVDDPYGPPPYFGPRFYRPRPAFFGPGFGPGPFGPRRFGWGGGWGGWGRGGWGPGPFF